MERFNARTSPNILPLVPLPPIGLHTLLSLATCFNLVSPSLAMCIFLYYIIHPEFLPYFSGFPLIPHIQIRPISAAYILLVCHPMTKPHYSILPQVKPVPCLILICTSQHILPNTSKSFHLTEFRSLCSSRCRGGRPGCDSLLRKGFLLHRV